MWRSRDLHDNLMINAMAMAPRTLPFSSSSSSCACSTSAASCSPRAAASHGPTWPRCSLMVLPVGAKLSTSLPMQRWSGKRMATGELQPRHSRRGTSRVVAEMSTLDGTHDSMSAFFFLKIGSRIMRLLFSRL